MAMGQTFVDGIYFGAGFGVGYMAVEMAAYALAWLAKAFMRWVVGK